MMRATCRFGGGSGCAERGGSGGTRGAWAAPTRGTVECRTDFGLTACPQPVEIDEVVRRPGTGERHVARRSLDLAVRAARRRRGSGPAVGHGTRNAASSTGAMPPGDLVGAAAPVARDLRQRGERGLGGFGSGEGRVLRVVTRFLASARNAAPVAGRDGLARGSAGPARRMTRTPHSSQPSMRSNTRSSSRRRFRISDEARPSVENIVKSFIGNDRGAGERAKNSTTAS